MTERYVPLTDTITETDVPFCVPVDGDPGHLLFYWPITKVEIHARRFGHQNGYAELEVWFESGEADRQLGLAPTNVQLSSIQQKIGLVNMLTRWDNTINWLWYVEAVAHEVRKRATAQNPMETIVSDPALSMDPEYLLWPLLYKGHPTIIFGSKASAKSLLAAVVSYIVQLHLTDNKLGLRPGADHANVCYGDWEDVTATFTARWTAIQRGFKTQHPEIAADLEVPILRKAMKTKLADAVDTLRSEFAERKVGLFIVDSLGPAAGGDLYAPQSALDFFEAVRSLNTTTLILAHHSKDPNTKSKSVFGSQFFTALARSVWHAESDQAEDSTDLAASIKEIECNLAPRHGIFGFKYAFDNNARTITVTQSDLKGTKLAKPPSHETVIAATLKRMGAMTNKEISDETGIPVDTVRVTTHRMAESTAAVRVGKHKWGIVITPET